MNGNSAIRVLIVEDDADIRDSLTEAFSGAGYQVSVARNGEHGLFLLRNEAIAPCVVVLDLTMPVMNGVEFLERLAVLEVRESVRVLVLSGDPSAAEARRFDTVSRVLAKPVNVRELVGAVARAQA